MTLRIMLMAISIIMLIRLIIPRQHRTLSWVSFVAWTIFWLSLGTVSLMPELTSHAAKWVGIGRGADLALYSAILILFLLFWKVFGTLNRMEHQITQIVRTLALMHPNGPEKEASHQHYLDEFKK